MRRLLLNVRRSNSKLASVPEYNAWVPTSEGFSQLKSEGALEVNFLTVFFQTFKAARASFLSENEKQELIDQLKLVRGIQ